MGTRFRAIALGVVGGLLAGSCAAPASGPPPVVCHGVRAVVGTVEGFHDVVGVYIAVSNTCAETVERLETEFYLFDGNGLATPRVGRSYFSVVYDEPLAPGERREICVDLDASFHHPPTAPLSVRRFRVSTVQLADGTLWSDPYGRYAWVEPTGGEEE